jgi:hypothetical protein
MMNPGRILAGLAVALVGCPSPALLEDAGSSSELDAAAEPVDAAVEPDAWIPPVPTRAPEVANAVAAGDPLFDGQQRFLYDTWGVEILGEWPPADFMIALMSAEPDVFGDQYARFGFLPDATNELPLGFVRGTEDSSEVHETCALCHTDRLPDGRLWFGVANQRLDFDAFRAAVSERWVAAGHEPLTTPQHLARIHLGGPGRFDTVGSDAVDGIPVDLPNLLDYAERTATNYGGTGANARTEIYLSTFAFGAGAPNAMTARVPFPPTTRIQPMVDFIVSLRPPPAPVGDTAAIERGAALFARERCDSCHHPDDVSRDGVVTISRMGAPEALPDTATPRGVIATDPRRFGLQDATGGSTAAGEVADFLRFITAHRLSVRASDGYRAGYLHALWATAPYLHNGSVPTLEDLLRPAAERPASFMRGEFLVDTTVPGNSNQGHEFGTAITEEERTDLAAYLRSL